MKKIKWGVLGTARIATEKVIPGMQRGSFCEIRGIASRYSDKAAAAAARLNIPKSYSSYEELLSDREIEAVYIPLPNHLHVPYTLKALDAGKHVLCEKPIALTAADAEKIISRLHYYPGLCVMEAFMYRFHPQWQKARELTREGAIGEPVTIHSFFSYYNTDPENVRNRADIGGGGLMDIGCYSVSLSRFIFNEEPDDVAARFDYDPVFKTDRLTSAILRFGNKTATFTCSTQLMRYQRVHIYGRTGRIEIEIPFNTPPDRSCRIWLENENGLSEIRFDPVDQYTLQGDQFSLAIINRQPAPTPVSDAVANMKILDALRSADRP